MVVSQSRPPLLLPRLLPECAYGLPTTRAETRTRASLVLPAPANDSSTVRHTQPDQHTDSTVGGPSVCFARCSCTCSHLSNNAAQIASVTSPRAVEYSHGGVPAKGTCVASAVPLSQGTISRTGTRAPCAVPLDHGSNSAKGTRAPSGVPLSRGIHSATGVCASSAAPLNHGKGACASHAAPPSHESCSNEAAATPRRSPKRPCSPLPLPDYGGEV